VHTGRMDSALAYLSAALLAVPDFTPAQILTARYLELRIQYGQAEPVLREAARRDTGSVEALLALGEYYLRGNQWELGEAALKVALAKDPQLARAQEGLARLSPERLQDLRLDNPGKLLMEAVRLDPAFELARIQLAHLMAGSGATGEAVRVLRDGLAINPASADLRLKLAAVEIVSGHAQAARELYESFLQDNPQDAIAIFNLGVLDYRAKLYDQAIDRFRTVQGLNGPVDCLYYLGLIYQAKGDRSRAKFFFRQRWEKRQGDNDAFGRKALEIANALESRPGG